MMAIVMGLGKREDHDWRGHVKAVALSPKL